jgi:tetratricopeptide (TPR) repeat protein
VASRTSAFSFRGTKVDIPTMAQKLNVATILEGSVRKSGKRVRITAQLIQAATDSHLWSETYDRELEDIFAVQDDIAQSVVKELREALLGEKPDALARAGMKAEVQAAAKGRGNNAEAYRLYLQGRFFGDRLTREDNAKAIDYYRQALERDPEYALAWAWLSLACNQQVGNWGGTTNVEGFRKVQEAAEWALQLQPDLAEGHLALGRVRLDCLDWKGADASFHRAFELAPGSAPVLSGAADLAGTLGRLDEAIALLRRAVMLDPLNAQAYQLLAGWCWRADLVDEAEVAATKALELDPRREVTRLWLGLAQMARGQLEDALETFKSETNVIHRLLGLTLVYHACGQSAQSNAAVREMIEKDADGSAYQIALAYAYRGEADLAFVWLERAHLQGDAGRRTMKVTPLLKNLHGDARWQPLLEKMGLAE